MEAYCIKCKTKREMNNPVADFNAAGAPVTRGVCPVCGTRLYRTGRTEAHAGMKAPAKEKEKGPERRGKLVIVESPAKARTVGRFLGKNYTVRASVGHVRDLLRSELSVDVDNDFKPKYRVPNEKRQVVKELKELASKAEEIYLATDPDREGEAIAWHLMEAAAIDPKISRRVVFHEITQPAVAEAFSNPRDINMDLVDAQQARRILDRLVGYSISPILWEKVRSRLSAGRVQSVALKLVVDREREIENFNSVEFWSIHGQLQQVGLRQAYVAKLVKINGTDAELPNETVARGLILDLESAAYKITEIRKGERRRRPNPPFTTSTLQQEASKRLGFTARKTMAVAQQLYEGLNVGEDGETGLITYMRTDSTNVAEVAQKEARAYIQQVYGKSYAPKTMPKYRTKSAGAQEAHGAIRPTSTLRSPEGLKGYLSGEQLKLYTLIWQRFVASQMEDAVFDTATVEINGQSRSAYIFRAAGNTLKFNGFLAVYSDSKEDETEEEENAKIPAGLLENAAQELKKLIPEQHFTQPPPRYTEATLVQTLDENGIGRPSTYAPILSTIQERGYVVRESKRLLPTETGFIVNDLLTQSFPDIDDVSFTAKMEEDLDAVATGKKHWRSVISNFYKKFEPEVRRAKEQLPVTKPSLELIGRKCPECGNDLVMRHGRFGKFISCSTFPTCRYSEQVVQKIGVKCPEDGGDLIERRTKKGSPFYGCSNYPKCKFISWKRPIKTPCPDCSGMLVQLTKNKTQCIECHHTFEMADSTQ